MRRRLAAGLSLLAVTALLAGCREAGAPAPDPLRVAWQEVALPAPPGPPGRAAVRDAVRCGDRWWLAGGVFLADPTPDLDSRPALWSSPDGAAWSTVPVRPTTYWGRRAVLASIACSEGRIAVVGAKSGGAHGNPRVTTWHLRASTDGGPEVLVDVVAAFSQYGGDRATNVGPVSGGPGGFLIVGNRTSGPAVWHSADGTEFTIVEGAPGLADDDQHRALAQAGAASASGPGKGWTVVGGGSTPGDLDRQPQAWRSSDGRSWSRERVPGGDAYEDLQRVVDRDGALVALGLRGDGFGAWWRGDRWHEGASFGEVDPDAGATPFVGSLALTGRRIWTTVSDGTRYALWHSADGVAWQPVPAPLTPATGGERILAVAGAADGVLLLGDDGARGRVWHAPVG